MKLILKKGVTSQTALVFIQDSSSTTGAGLTGLAYNTASLSWYYYREGAGTGATAVTLATATLGTFSSGGFIVVDGTNMPGWYEISIPNAALATGADFVGMQLKGATNMAPLNIEIQLVDVDLADGVRFGLTALPNAAADAAGGLPISDAGGLDLDAQVVTKINAILADTGTDGVVVAAASKTGYSLTATTGLGNQTADITGSLSGSVGSVTGAVGSVTGAVGSVTGNVGGNVVGSVGSLTTNNDKTGYALSATGSAAMTEGYAALGAAGTLPQILYEIRALLAEKSIATTTLTTKKLDGSTTAATYTLDDATTPSAITRAT